MMQNNREKDALRAYLRLLQSKGADSAVLEQREALALLLIPLLAPQPLDGGLYRDCVEKVLQDLEQTLWPAFLLMAREYFHFWTGDIKTIAAMHANGNYRTAAASPPAENLKSLWERVDGEQFSITETWALKAYAAALRGEGADKPVVETRVKLVKVLLLSLRGAEDKSAAVYRSAVDSAAMLFGMNETRQLFLLVVREFFYFWIGNPDARNHIVLDQDV